MKKVIGKEVVSSDDNFKSSRLLSIKDMDNYQRKAIAALVSLRSTHLANIRLYLEGHITQEEMIQEIESDFPSYVYSKLNHGFFMAYEDDEIDQEIDARLA